MSDDNKPIFPRSSESSNEEKNELRQQTKLNLEAEEQQFRANNDTVERKFICSKCQTESSINVAFCRVCGNKLDMSAPPPPDTLNKVLTLKDVHILAPTRFDNSDNVQSTPYTEIKVRRHLPRVRNEILENQPAVGGDLTYISGEFKTRFQPPRLVAQAASENGNLSCSEKSVLVDLLSTLIIAGNNPTSIFDGFHLEF